jgi:serine protease
MRRRIALSLALLFAVSLGSVVAEAAKIDQDLLNAMANKIEDELVPVIMIYDDAPSVDSIFMELEALDPEKRRKRVIEALKKKNQKMQRNAAIILDDPNHRDELADVTYLYFAGAITFDGSPELVSLLGGLDDNATLFLDKTYDLSAATTRGVDRAEAQKADRTVTAWSVDYIDAPRVWNELGYTGNGVIVGHIDTGVYLSHPDLAGGLWVNPGEIAGNGIDDDNNGFVDDINGWDFGVGDNNPNDDSPGAGHGTHTAGNVIGDGTNGTITGVAPGAKLIACKVWQADGSGGTLGMIYEAEQYCAEMGARIITMSLGIPGELPASYMRAERVNNNNLRDAGVAFFNSSGNEHYSYSPPFEVGLTARCPAPWMAGGIPHSSLSGVIAVGGTGYQNDLVYTASSRGPVNWGDVEPYNDWDFSTGNGLIKPDVAAPGTNVNSTVIPSGYSGNSWSGTSMACPHAAGLAALMLEKNPSLSVAGIDSLMELNAIDLGTVGKDNVFGSGRIDAFAIVDAVPMTQAASIFASATMPDPAGDSVIDPGETSGMAFELTNNSLVLPAEDVTATLAVVPNPYVTVGTASAPFADMAINGGTADNTANPFTLVVAPAAPQGFEFTMLLTVFAGTTFEKTFDIPWYVGLPEFRTHNAGNVYLTVTDYGTLGYMDANHSEGNGMGYLDGGSGLYLGSFWASMSSSYVCARDFSGSGQDPYEWETQVEPNGRVMDLGASSSDQTFQSIYTDSGHEDPLPLTVQQTSYAFGTEPNDKFVILEYTLTNDAITSYSTFRTAIFCDFDIGDSSANEGGSDAANKLVYMYSGSGPYYGVSVVGDASAANLTLLNNPTWVYPNEYIDNGIKLRHMTGAMSTPFSTGPDDWSAICSQNVALNGSGGTATVVFAMLYGETLADLQASAIAANAAYSPTTPVTMDTPYKVIKLAQNHPNPFNPITSIKYVMPRDGHAEIAVYSIDGRRVRTLISGNVAMGEHSVTWDGTDDSGVHAASGIYFYKLEADGEVTSRKMTLVK